MKIFLNSKEIEVESEINITDFLLKYGDCVTVAGNIPQFGFALALNNTVIKKENWATTFLAENDKILLIKAVCGG
jgi:sulfur carrier protein